MSESRLCPFCNNVVAPIRGESGQMVCPLCQNRGFSPTAAAGVPAYAGVPMAVPAPNAPGAVASLVLGILSLAIPYVGFILGIIAIVMGRRARRACTNDLRLGGQGMAIAGLVLGIVSLALWGIVLVIVGASIVFVLVSEIGGEIEDVPTMGFDKETTAHGADLRIVSTESGVWYDDLSLSDNCDWMSRSGSTVSPGDVIGCSSGRIVVAHIPSDALLYSGYA